jgi:hypothetical protein
MLQLTFEEWTKQKLDWEVTEVLRQEWSCDHAEGTSSNPNILSTYKISTYTQHTSQKLIV